MSQLSKADFEKDLLTKLRLKCDGRFNEEQILTRAFKFVDMDNSGYCDKESFSNAMRKLGVVCVNEDNIDSIFAVYDKDKQGEFEYAALIKELFKPLQKKKKKDPEEEARRQAEEEAKRQAEEKRKQEELEELERQEQAKIAEKRRLNEMKVHPELMDSAGKYKDHEPYSRKNRKFKPPYGTIEDRVNAKDEESDSKAPKFDKTKLNNVIAHFRSELKLRGTRGVMSLRRTFMLIDENSNGFIEYKEFKKIFKTYRIPFTDEEIEMLFRFFDNDGSGKIDYNEFITGILGDINDFRTKILKNVFNRLDKDKTGFITVGDLRENYLPGQNTSCRLGKKTEQAVLAEFIDLLEYHFNMLNESEGENVDTNDIKIDFDSFINFYKNISFLIDDDRIFEIQINGEWGIGNIAYQKGWRNMENIN